MNTPVAKKIPHELTIHGHTRIDDYYWLNERENPEVTAYLKEENAYFEEETKDFKPLQDELFKEIKGRIKEEDMSVPIKKHGYLYYSRQETGKEYSIHCRKKVGEDVEQILLDGNKMAEGHHFFQIGNYAVSPDDCLLAYCVDYVSRRKYELHFRDIATGLDFPDTVKDISPDLAWGNDNKTVFYTLLDESLRPYKVMRHTIGTDSKDDVVVYVEEDETFIVSVSKAKSEKYIYIVSESTLSSETRILDADNPLGTFSVFCPRRKNVLYGLGHFHDEFYIVTNDDDARNFKIMKTSVSDTKRESWKEVIAHREDTLIEDIDIFDKYLVIEERRNGLVQIRVKTWDGAQDYYIGFNDPAYTVQVLGNPDFDTDMLRYCYDSMTTPASVYEYDMTSHQATLLKQKEIVGGYNSSDYICERLKATSHDGVEVPISIVYKKGIKLNGENPLVLYGYGSYGISTDAYFSTARISLLDRGFIWAIAHIRGGEEMGRQWYEDGKMLKKKNTFLDFIECAKHLIKKGYSRPEKMFAMGGSAGGLLVGAVANMAPELWKGIIANVPFVDVVTTMLDDTIPLTTGEYDEWGNPNEKKYYDYMLSYSPYDNVEEKNYPAMLVTTGLHDSQVQYWEPAKWVAKLRDKKTDNNKLFLKTDMDFGHGGASGRFEAIKEIALEYAFMMDCLMFNID